MVDGDDVNGRVACVVRVDGSSTNRP